MWENKQVAKLDYLAVISLELGYFREKKSNTSFSHFFVSKRQTVLQHPRVNFNFLAENGLKTHCFGLLFLTLN